MDVFNKVLLYAAILLAALYFAATILQKRKFLGGEISDRSYYVLLTLVALVALGVRVYQFGAIPGGFNQDGAMAAVDAKALADYGTDRLGMRYPVHLTAWGYGQMSALMSYMMVPFIKLFGLSSVTARLPVLLVSLGGLSCLYLFARDVWGKNAALAVLFFAAIDPWHIVQSRWALDCNLFPHFFMAGVYFLNRGTERGKYNIAISMVMFALCMYCYGISIYTVPVFLLAACIYLLVIKKIKLRLALMALAVWLLVAWPFIAVMVINYFKLDTVETALFTLPYFSGSVRSADILFFSEDIAGQLVQNIKSLVSVALLQKPDLPWNEVSLFGTVYLFSMPFAIVGLCELCRNMRKSAGKVLLLMFLLTGVLAGVLTNGVNINRVNLIFYPNIFLCGLGIWRLGSFLGRVKWCIPAVYLLAFTFFTAKYFTDYAEQIADCFFEDFGAAVTSIKDDDADKMYITADVQYVGSWNVSEILTLFYHEIDAKYYQGQTPAGEIPFADKYVFSSICNINITPDSNTVYIVTQSDLTAFDANSFYAESFGSYYVVRAK